VQTGLQFCRQLVHFFVVSYQVSCQMGTVDCGFRQLFVASLDSSPHTSSTVYQTRGWFSHGGEQKTKKLLYEKSKGLISLSLHGRSCLESSFGSSIYFVAFSDCLVRCRDRGASYDWSCGLEQAHCMQLVIIAGGTVYRAVSTRHIKDMAVHNRKHVE